MATVADTFCVAGSMGEQWPTRLLHPRLSLAAMYVFIFYCGNVIGLDINRFFLCVWKLTVRLKFVIGSDEMWKHMIKHGAPVPWIQASKQQTNYVTDSEGICNVHSSALNALCGSFLVGGNAKLPISSLPRLIINILSLTITTLIIIITKRYILIYWMIYQSF